MGNDRARRWRPPQQGQESIVHSVTRPQIALTLPSVGAANLPRRRGKHGKASCVTPPRKACPRTGKHRAHVPPLVLRRGGLTQQGGTQEGVVHSLQPACRNVLGGNVALSQHRGPQHRWGPPSLGDVAPAAARHSTGKHRATIRAPGVGPPQTHGQRPRRFATRLTAKGPPPAGGTQARESVVHSLPPTYRNDLRAGKHRHRGPHSACGGRAQHRKAARNKSHLEKFTTTPGETQGEEPS